MLYNVISQQFTSDVLDVIDRGQELHLPIQKKPSKHQHESWCQRSHSHVVPTIEHWQDQLMSYRVSIRVEQGSSNFFPGDPNVSIKIFRDPKQKNVNLPKQVRGVSLLSFTEFTKSVWGILDIVEDMQIYA